MISVESALDQLLALATPLPIEYTTLTQASGRVLATSVTAQHSQPPFSASAMDGYAVTIKEARIDAEFDVIGEAAAGRHYRGTVHSGQAVRIFTGAPLPAGTDFVVIQEDVVRHGTKMRITSDPGTDRNVRPEGGDFRKGRTIDAPRFLNSRDIALMAAMNIIRIPVYQKPNVAIIPTGDELVFPGDQPNKDQIFASNVFGLKSMLDQIGANSRIMPIARDSLESLRTVFELASEADLVLTIGGASVGDYDLVGEAAKNLGMQRSFYKVAMRPGKPLMAGRLSKSIMLGLPGNPVSAMVCGYVFVEPLIRKMQGISGNRFNELQIRLSGSLSRNGSRKHYMRALREGDKVLAFEQQDSSLLSVLAAANALLIRPPYDPARSDGDLVTILPI